MKINLNELIYAVLNMFDETEEYYKKAKGANWYCLADHERTYYERNSSLSSNNIYDITRILNIDIKGLYIIAKSIRKWEKRCNWEKCFPIEENSQKILEYLMNYKSEPEQYGIQSFYGEGYENAIAYKNMKDEISQYSTITGINFVVSNTFNRSTYCINMEVYGTNMKYGSTGRHYRTIEVSVKDEFAGIQKAKYYIRRLKSAYSNNPYIRNKIYEGIEIVTDYKAS